MMHEGNPLDCTTLKAKRELEEKQRITDPTLIPIGSSRDSTEPIDLLDEMASKGVTLAKPEDPLEVKLGAHWNNRISTKNNYNRRERKNSDRSQ